jgi:hypothetical protein
MDGESFDAVVQRAAVAASRRGVLRAGVGALAGVALGAVGTALGFAGTEATHVGCRHIGDRCKRATQCCSGICERKNGQRRCTAHNSGGCTAQFDGCKGLVVGCGTAGFCFRTTGKASFCGGPGGDCVDCTKDVDCQEKYGDGAACVVCEDCVGNGSNGTACYPAAA